MRVAVAIIVLAPVVLIGAVVVGDWLLGIAMAVLFTSQALTIRMLRHRTGRPPAALND
jgi:hypothetical protein